MKKLSVLLIACLAALFSLALMSCPAGGDSAGGETGYTLSGTLTVANNEGVPTIEAATAGDFAYLKLVVFGGTELDDALYFARSTAFSGNQATYSFSDVAEGPYTGWVFIDANHNAAGDETSMPDTGDYVTDGGGDITITGDKEFDLTAESWIPYSE